MAGAVLLGVLYAFFTSGEMAEYGIICGIGALISMVEILRRLPLREIRESKITVR